MADKKLVDAGVQTTMSGDDYIVIKKNNDTYQIKASDLATVVGGLIGAPTIENRGTQSYLSGINSSSLFQDVLLSNRIYRICNINGIAGMMDVIIARNSSESYQRVQIDFFDCYVYAKKTAGSDSLIDIYVGGDYLYIAFNGGQYQRVTTNLRIPLVDRFSLLDVTSTIDASTFTKITIQ